MGFAHLQVSVSCLGNNAYRDISLIPGFNWILFSEYQIKYEDERVYMPKKGSSRNSLEVLST